MIVVRFFFLFYYTHNSFSFFFFQAEDGIRDIGVTGVQTCAFRSAWLTATVPHEARASACVTRALSSEARMRRSDSLRNRRATGAHRMTAPLAAADCSPR